MLWNQIYKFDETGHSKMNQIWKEWLRRYRKKKKKTTPYIYILNRDLRKSHLFFLETNKKRNQSFEVENWPSYSLQIWRQGWRGSTGKTWALVQPAGQLSRQCPVNRNNPTSTLTGRKTTKIPKCCHNGDQKAFHNTKLRDLNFTSFSSSFDTCMVWRLSLYEGTGMGQWKLIVDVCWYKISAFEVFQ